MKRELEDKELNDVSGGRDCEICNPTPGGTPCTPGPPVGGSPGVGKDSLDPRIGDEHEPGDFNQG